MKITLKKDEAALVFGDDKEFPDIYVPKKKMVSSASQLAVCIAVLLKTDKVFFQYIDREWGKIIKKAEKMSREDKKCQSGRKKKSTKKTQLQ